MGGWIGHKLYLKFARWVPLFSSITTGLGVIATVLTISYRPVGGIGLLMLMVLGFASAALVSLTGPNVKMMLLNVNEPGDRGRIFSVFNLTDSLGTGVGKYFGGVVSAALGSLGAALILSFYFWIACSALLFVLIFYFEKDIVSLSNRMKRIRGLIE